ncbi:hypothetical protein [Stenotrophomonas sp.]|uniref:hypothetical protein n=1 Tax=Stenotrophomonas sp. TaxID=69392 RepID=UPI0028A58FE1|nr:hypothetical protein [Stenotrophomonas sp.]
MRYAAVALEFVRLAIRDIIRREMLIPWYPENRYWAARQLKVALDSVDDDSWSAALPKGGDSVRFYNKKVKHLLRQAPMTAFRFHSEALSLLDKRGKGANFSLASIEAFSGWQEWPVPGRDRQWRLLRWLGRKGAVHTQYGQRAAEPSLYFAFLEEKNAIEPGRDVYGGDGRVLSRIEEGGGLMQIRFAAIPCTQFFDAADQIDDLEPGFVSDEARRVRLLQLRENLGGADLPVIDLLISSQPSWAVRLPVGTWWVLGLGGGRPTLGDARIFLTDTSDPREQSDTEPLALGIFGDVPPYWLRRLRDIFSLAHVADADIGGRPGPG